MEKVNLKKLIYQVKVLGTLVTVGGAMLMTLYKGPIIEMVWSKHAHSSTSNNTATHDKDWVKGSILVILATLAWSALFIIQKITLKHYSHLSLTTLICFVGTLQSIAVTLVMEHKASVWRIGWDMNLLAAAYSGIVTSSLAYYIQGIVMEVKDPVFATAFSPLMMIIVAIMGSFILAEKIYLGGVLGAILIVFGLYSVLWGKHKEGQEEKRLEQAKGIEGKGCGEIEDIEANVMEKQEKPTAKSACLELATLAAATKPPAEMAVNGVTNESNCNGRMK